MKTFSKVLALVCLILAPIALLDGHEHVAIYLLLLVVWNKIDVATAQQVAGADWAAEKCPHCYEPHEVGHNCPILFF